MPIMCWRSKPTQTLWANKGWFEQAQAQNFAGIEVSRDEHVESHHRIEKRQVFSVPLALLHQQASWIGLKSVVMVVRTRQLWNKTTHQVQFYLTSLESDATVARAILHWGIENQLHWTLDVTFAEDASRVRTGHAPQNLALLRRISIVSIASYPSNAAHGRNLIEQRTMIICLKYSLLVLPQSTSMRNPLVNGV